jgi:cadmium resistance protein CadD (predicted permease)
VSIELIGTAIGLFTLTNIDSLVILVLFFGQATGPADIARVVIGQYLGFVVILVMSILGGLGVRLVAGAASGYFGLLPIALGLLTAGTAWRRQRKHPTPVPVPAAGDRGDGATETDPQRAATGPTVLVVATVTVASGGDNLSAYTPVFGTTGLAGLLTYVVAFLVLVAVWCAAGLFFARRHLVAGLLSRWSRVVLPVVLIGIGLAVLIQGHAFGL